MNLPEFDFNDFFSPKNIDITVFVAGNEEVFRSEDQVKELFVDLYCDDRIVGLRYDPVPVYFAEEESEYLSITISFRMRQLTVKPHHLYEEYAEYYLWSQYKISSRRHYFENLSSQDREDFIHDCREFFLKEVLESCLIGKSRMDPIIDSINGEGYPLIWEDYWKEVTSHLESERDIREELRQVLLN